VTEEINNIEEEKSQIVKPSLFGMVMNPTEQFQRLRENPKILVAIIVVTILTIIGTFMMLSGIDFLDQPELAEFSEEEKMMVAMIGQISFVVVGAFVPIFSILISTIVFIIIAKIVKTDVTFKQLFSMNTYIFIIGTIGILLNGIVFMLLGGEEGTMFTSLNSVVGAESFLGVFLESLEVFSIWSLIITAIGLQIVAKFSKGLSWAVVIGFYIVGLTFQMISVGLSTMLGV